MLKFSSIGLCHLRGRNQQFKSIFSFAVEDDIFGLLKKKVCVSDQHALKKDILQEV